MAWLWWAPGVQLGSTQHTYCYALTALNQIHHTLRERGKYENKTRQCCILNKFEESPPLKKILKALELYSDRLHRPHRLCEIGFCVIISGQ